MPPADYRIVYLSRALVRLSDEGLDQLGQQAAQANAQHGVSGYLLYDGLRFLQAIEGPRAAIRQLMQNIQKDARHDSIECFDDQAIDRRAFGSWSLAFQRVEAGRCTRAFIDRVAHGVAEVGDPQLKAVFIGFAALAAKRRPG